MATPVAATAAEAPDWQGLPPGVLQHIFGFTSTWQCPGCCRTAPVCRSWHKAAAGCRDTLCLLYHAGDPAADQSLVAWLGRNSRRLGSFTLSSSRREAGHMILDALAQAAAAAVEAGSPLPLHILRVLGFKLDLPIIRKLLASQLRLSTLQLSVAALDFSAGDASGQPMGQWVRQHAEHVAFAPATQLQNLYLEGPDGGVLVCAHACRTMAGLLPTSLARLSWSPGYPVYPPDLSHLTQLSFLQLKGWQGAGLLGRNSSSSKVPPSLRELHLSGEGVSLEVVQAQQQVLVGLDRDQPYNLSNRIIPTLECLPKLQAMAVRVSQLQQPDVCAALKQLSQLDTLTVRLDGPEQAADMRAVVSTAAGIPSLRALHVEPSLGVLPNMPGLQKLTSLTRVRLSSYGRVPLGYASKLGQMPLLRWLSVPEALLLEASGPWLGGMQQLCVLMAHGQPHQRGTPPPGAASVPSMFQALAPGLPLPPKLLVVGWAGVLAESGAAQPLRGFLKQRLGSSGCEVVIGVDLDEVCDPVKQLAGVPEALQQAMA